MKKSVTRIGAAILGLVILFGTMTAMASQLYPDLAPNHWCYKKIMEFVDKGYIDGYEDGTMRPNQTITRAEYVKVVNNFFGFKDGKTDKKFSDISDDAWYAKYVYAAVAQGYISGYEDNTFRPSKPITRQEATVILSRILKIDKEVYPKDHVDGLAQYSDGNEVADWAYTAIHSYSVYNFINGYEDGTLKILQNVTRAETVELLHVLEQKIEIDRPYGRTKTTKMPTINIIVEVGKNEFKPATTVNGWFNNENSCKNDDIDGVYVNITTTTDGATIYEKVNPRDPADRNYVTTTGNDFKNMFFLTDGVYDVSAYAKKTGRKTSGTNKVTLKIDTMAPCVEAKVLDNETNPKSNVAHTQKISVTLKDVIPSGLTEDKVSGVNEASAKYTWFIESGEDGFVRVGEWTSLSNGQVVETPTKYGKYKLAVSVKDNAGNSFGDEFDGEIRYDFVEDGETTPSEDIVVEVGNNAPQAEDLVLSTKLGIVASGDIVAFDSDGGDKLTYTIETKPISGEATVDAVTGRVTYTPSEKGTFTFTVKVSDGNESGDTIATVTVAVEDLNYTVNYYLKGTTNKLATSKFVDNQFFSTKILAVNEAIAIDGYNYDSADKEELIIGLNENVINLYYAKRTDLSYTVKYLEKETNNVLEDAKVVENQTFGDKITETAIEIDGYNKVAPTSGEVEITTGTNEITFYYEKRTDLSYIVNYYLEGTTSKVATSKTENGKTFEEEVTENAIDIAGYTKVEPTTKTIKISADESKNVINFYYTKRADLSYTVNYYLENTTTKVATSKTENGKTFEEEVTENAIDIAGYTKVEPTTKTIKISADESKNVINFYYTKRTDLSYTVNYYLEGTTTKVATSKTVNDKTFEEEVTENAIDVAGYTKVAPTTKTITISTDESKNVINFYYTKRTDLSYTVNYYLEGTTTKVATSKTVNGKTFEEEVTENAIDVAGYTKVEPTTKTITISADESKNVINFYYKKNEGKLIANIKCNYPTKDGVKAEPGDTLKYKITLEEDGEAVSYPKTISIKLDADVEKPTNLPSNASYDETTHTITWTVSSKDDKLTYNVKVKKETPAGSKADTIITGATANGATSVDIEATVAVKVDKNKNVVLVLDVSGSMDACVKHDKFFERKFMSSKIGHYYGLSFEECSEKSRLEVMQEAAKNFTKSIIDERNTEDITITIVTFGDSAVNKGTLKNPTAAQVNAVINKLSANGGTNMRGAIKGATQVLNSSKMLENAVDYVVVLSDGDPEANQYYCDTATLNAFYATKANAYAIGFGNNYKKDELLKIVNNDSSKLFDAADADKLEDAFRKIGSEINKAQTAEGKIDVNVTGIKLYPIKLTYKNKDSETVNVTVKDSSELTSNNLSIVDGKLVWDISKYPGCTGFHVEVNRTKTIATLMLLAEEYGLEDVILVYGDPTITDKLPEEIEDVSGEDEEIIDDTVIGPKQPVSGDTETKILEETSGDTEIKPGKELSGDAEIQPTDETSGDPEKTEVDDKTSGDVEEKTEEVISGDSEIQPTDETSGDPEKTEVDAKTSGDVEEKTEEVVSGDVETKATEKVSGDSENKTEEKSDNKDVKPTQETSGDVAKEETKQQEKKTEEPKAEETEQIEEPKSEETKQQEEKKSEKIIEKEEETKATVEEVVVPEIKDPLENEEKDEKAA